MRQFLHVFHVHQRKTPRIALEIGQGVLSGNTDPAEVHLHLHQVRVGRFEQIIVRQFAAKTCVRSELPPVIVVAKLDPGLLARFAGLVELLRNSLPVVGGLTQFLINVRANDEAVADRVSGVDRFRPFLLHDVVVDVAGWRSQPVLVQSGADFAR